MKGILSLTDFSEVAEWAVDAAIRLAGIEKVPLTIYHNMGDDEIITFDITEHNGIGFLGSIKDVGPTVFNQWKKRSEEVGVQTKYLISSGNLIDKVDHIRQAVQADLVVLGSSGVGKKSPFSWGSSAQKIARMLDAPILVLKEELKSTSFKSIVFASSFEPQDLEAFEHFKKIINIPSEVVFHFLSVDTISFFSQPSVIMQTSMDSFVKAAAPYKAETHFYPDYSVEAGIRHFLDETEPDLLVMSNRNSKPIKRIFQGNSAINAMNLSGIPVMLIDY